MRDYKLRKRVYNSFVDGDKLEKKTSAMTSPVGVDEEGKLWASGGGGGGGETWTPDIEFAITLGEDVSGEDAQYFSNPSKTLSDFAQLGEGDEINGKKVLLTMNHVDYSNTYKCVIINAISDEQAGLINIFIMPDISANPYHIEPPAMLSTLNLNGTKIIMDGSAFVVRYSVIPNMQNVVAYADHIEIGTFTGNAS